MSLSEIFDRIFIQNDAILSALSIAMLIYAGYCVWHGGMHGGKFWTNKEGESTTRWTNKEEQPITFWVAVIVLVILGLFFLLGPWQSLWLFMTDIGRTYL